jgi:hypothetical protein
VLGDQRAVRKSIGVGFRHMQRNLGPLFGSYLVTTVVAALVLAMGIFVWIKLVPPTGLLGAVLVSQFTLLLLLIPRFWQRGIAVSYYLQDIVEPIPVVPLTPAPVVEPEATEAIFPPVIPVPPPEPAGI